MYGRCFSAGKASQMLCMLFEVGMFLTTRLLQKMLLLTLQVNPAGATQGAGT